MAVNTQMDSIMDPTPVHKNMISTQPNFTRAVATSHARLEKLIRVPNLPTDNNMNGLQLKGEMLKIKNSKFVPVKDFGSLTRSNEDLASCED